MGTYHAVYLGPYLEVPSAVQTQVLLPVARCPTAGKKHKVTSEMKFCPECGAPVTLEERTHTSSTLVNLYHIDDEAGNLLFMPQSLWETADSGQAPGVWISNNHKRLGGRSVDDEVIDLTNVDTGAVDDAVHRFYGEIEWVIDAIREKFGVEAVVKYGIVSYYH